jgi:hypothetical protein
MKGVLGLGLIKGVLGLWFVCVCFIRFVGLDVILEYVYYDFCFARELGLGLMQGVLGLGLIKSVLGLGCVLYVFY